MNRPPALPASFITGHTKLFAEGPIQYIENCEKLFGSIFYSKVAFQNIYFVVDAEYALHVLQKNNKNYVKSFAYAGLKDFLGEGLLTNEGESWLQHRRLIQPMFYKQKMGSIGDDMLKVIDEKITNWSGKNLNMNVEFLNLTGAIISQAMFGDTVENDAWKMFESLNDLRIYTRRKMLNPFKLPPPFPTSINRKYKAALKVLEDFIYPQIEKRKGKEAEHADLLSMLMAVKDESTGETMSNNHLRDELVTMYIAGQETTSNGLGFGLYCLAKNTTVLRKLEEELAKLGPNPKAKDILSVDYLKNVVSEILRLFPPVWAVSRKALEKDEIGGFEIPKGSTVFIPFLNIHRHPKYWEEPEQFIPERFEGEDWPKHAYMPFSKGARQCIGNNFALMEMQLTIARLVTQFELKLTSKQDVELITLMTLSSKEPFYFELNPNKKFKELEKEYESIID